ncbi:MAG TPA: CHAP domain-containing protein [Candidatus Binatia bacterium]|nr:CHAP domain-containing protein [Candidatus Binatia bacterium]
MLGRSGIRWSRVLPVTICLVVVIGMVGSGLHTVRAQGQASAYTPLSPFRILDTRDTGSPLGQGGIQDLTVAGVDSVPLDATAVVLNVTVTDPTQASYLSVYPAGEPTPVISNLNFTSGETVPNLAVVEVGANGQVELYNSAGTVQVVVDLEGYFEASGGGSAGTYSALTPGRITDTRKGSGEPNAGHRLTQGGTLNVQVDGAGGVPAAGVSAVSLNVTVTDTSRASYLTAYPNGTAQPLASNLNWSPGDTVANRVIVPVGTGGQVSFYNATGNVDLVIDVDGYFSDGSSTPPNASLYYPVSPVRFLDTRADAGTLRPSSYLDEQFAGVAGISPTADAVVANLTSVNATQGSFFTMAPEESYPATSDVNFRAGQVVPNLVMAALSPGGSATIYNASGTADALVDVFGYFQPLVAVYGAPAEPCVGASLDMPSNQNPQGPFTVSATASCPGAAQPLFEYWFKPWYSSVWDLAQSWTASDSFTYDFTYWTVGTYDLSVWVSSDTEFQSDASASYVVSEPTYQWQANTIPPESTLQGDLVSQANAAIIDGCYGSWSQGRACGENGSPGQCTFWAELNWASPYYGRIVGNAAQLPTSYRKLTGQGLAATPSVGALVIWNGPSILADSSAGHTAVVTSVAADGSSYDVSQMNWSDQGWDISTMLVPFNPAENTLEGLMGFLPAG